MSRSKNGMGSVRRRADGRWEGRYSDPNGRQRSVYAKTQKECTQKLKEALRAVDTGSWLEPATLTVAGWLDQWLADYQGHTSGRDSVEPISDLVNAVYNSRLSAVGGEMIGCCDMFVMCSDALKCLRSKDPHYNGCLYRKNLEAGRIFYGKNKNI